VGSFDKEGYYSLEFDYNQDPELVMASLKARVKAEPGKALGNYQ